MDFKTSMQHLDRQAWMAVIDARGAYKDTMDLHILIQYTTRFLEATIPDLLNCHVVGYNLCHKPL